jgi:hypothetical protein
MSHCSRSYMQYCIAGKVPSYKRIPILEPQSRCWLQRQKRERNQRDIQTCKRRAPERNFIRNE